MPLPIYNESYRPSANWLQQLQLKQASLRQHEPFNPQTTAQLAQHLLVEQVTENFLLSDIAITKERVQELIEGAAPTTETEQAVLDFAQAVRHLNNLLEQAQPKESLLLTADLLRELHNITLGGKGGNYRTEEGRSLAPGHDPAHPQLLPKFIDNALGWFDTDSFRELHPLEQAWLVHLRLMELQPFAQANGRVVRLVASIYAQRANIAPIIIKTQDREEYNNALAAAFQMITQPGIELFAACVIRTLDEMLAIVEKA